MASKIGTEKVKNYLSNLGRKDSNGKILFQRILIEAPCTQETFKESVQDTVLR